MTADACHPPVPAHPAPRRRAAHPALRHTLRVAGGWLLAGWTAAALGAAPALTALAEPGNAEHHVGKVVFAELVTPDLEASKRFYAQMFGWVFRDVPQAGTVYTEASIDGHLVAALQQRAPSGAARRQPAWLPFFAVLDVDSAKAVAAGAGARLLFETPALPDLGREAVFADPQGARFAVLASSSGDPPDVLADPGEWIWAALFTTDPDADAGFYQTLFGYEVFDLPSDADVHHLLFASEDVARASANTLRARAPNGRAHWLNFIRVEHTAEAAARVVALGGTIVVEPRLDRHGAQMAVVADPAGARFGLLEWPQTLAVGVLP